MLQLFLAVAFSAVPLTLYVPPIRNLCLFVDTVEQLFHHTSGVFTQQLRPQLRLALSRLLFTSTSRMISSCMVGTNWFIGSCMHGTVQDKCASCCMPWTICLQLA